MRIARGGLINEGGIMSSEYGTYFAESSACGQKTQCSEQEVMAGD